MYPTADSALLTTHEAARLLGYTHDYIARMCREKRIRGERRGPQWVVEREELERFAREHDARLAETRAAVSATRRHEREGRQIIRTDQAVPFSATRNTSYRRSAYARRIRNELVAIGIAVAVTGGAVAVSESQLLAMVSTRAADTAMLAAAGAREMVYAYGDSLRLKAGHEGKPRVAVALTETSYKPFMLPRVPEMPQSGAFVFLRPTEKVRASVSIGSTTERPVTIPSLGEGGLMVGAYMRDSIAQIPEVAYTKGVSVGRFFVSVPEHALSLHRTVIQGFVELPEPISRFAIGSLFSVGSAARSIAASVPASTLAIYSGGTKALAELGPQALSYGVETEIAFGKALTVASHATSRMALEPVVRVATFAPQLREGAAYIYNRADKVARLGDELAYLARRAADTVLATDMKSYVAAMLTSTYEPLTRALGSVQAALGVLSHTALRGGATNQTKPYAAPGSAPSTVEASEDGFITAPSGGEYLWAGTVTESASIVRERLGVRELERAAEDGAFLRRFDGSELQISPLAPLVEETPANSVRSSSWIADTVDLITGAMDKENAERICIEDRCYTKEDVIRLLNESGSKGSAP